MLTFFPSPSMVGSESESDFFRIRIRIHQKVTDSFGFEFAILVFSFKCSICDSKQLFCKTATESESARESESK
jgi:hypothetical protein